MQIRSCVDSQCHCRIRHKSCSPRYAIAWPHDLSIIRAVPDDATWAVGWPR